MYVTILNVQIRLAELNTPNMSAHRTCQALRAQLAGFRCAQLAQHEQFGNLVHLATPLAAFCKVHTNTAMKHEQTLPISAAAMHAAVLIQLYALWTSFTCVDKTHSFDGTGSATAPRMRTLQSSPLWHAIAPTSVSSIGRGVQAPA